MSTLGQMRTQLDRLLPDGYHSTILTDTVKDGFLNEALRWVCQQHNFTFMETEANAETVDEQRRYLLPTESTDVNDRQVLQFKSERSIELINSENYRVELTKRQKKSIEEDPEYIDTDQVGVPKVYDIKVGTIDLFPLPDHGQNDDTAWTVNFDYYGYLQAMSGDNDTNFVTDEYPRVLEFRAARDCFLHGGDKEEANYYKATADEVLGQMIREDGVRANAGLEEGFKPRDGQQIGVG